MSAACEECGVRLGNAVWGEAATADVTGRYCRRCAARRLYPDRVDLMREQLPEPWP